MLDLIKRETGLSNGAAAEWLSDKGFTELPRSEPPRAPKVVAVYPYTDEGGALLFEVCRCEPKTFRQRRPDGSGGWIWKLEDTRRVLYRLPELVAAPRALSSS